MMDISRTTIRDLTGIYIRGLCMGAADAVPGVSGGTIALITGIYERLIGALTAVEPGRIWRLVRGVRYGNRDEAAAAYTELDIGFLLALGAGIITAIVTVLRLISVLIATNPVETYGFFFGLIAASAMVMSAEVSLATRGRKVAALSGFLFAFLISGYVATTAASTLPLVFLSGAVAVTAMILPGVSGSLLLLMFGQYKYMSRTLRAFTDALVASVSGAGFGQLVAYSVPVVTFLTGGIVGLFTVSHTVRWALDRYREATVAFLVSLIVGALRAPVEQVSLELVQTGTGWTLPSLGLFLGVGALGAVAVIATNYLAGGVDTMQAV